MKTVLSRLIRSISRNQQFSQGKQPYEANFRWCRHSILDRKVLWIKHYLTLSSHRGHKAGETRDRDGHPGLLKLSELFSRTSGSFVMESLPQLFPWVFDRIRVGWLARPVHESDSAPVVPILDHAWVMFRATVLLEEKTENQILTRIWKYDFCQDFPVFPCTLDLLRSSGDLSKISETTSHHYWSAAAFHSRKFTVWEVYRTDGRFTWVIPPVLIKYFID